VGRTEEMIEGYPCGFLHVSLGRQGYTSAGGGCKEEWVWENQTCLLLSEASVVLWKETWWKCLDLLCVDDDIAGRRARKETDRLCFDNEAGGRDGKAER
jgi:hypothetical protein